MRVSLTAPRDHSGSVLGASVELLVGDAIGHGVDACLGGELAIAEFEAAETDGRLDAEQVASRRLKVPAVAVALAARHTWGRGLTEERDTRVAQRVKPDANPRTVQAAGGHVTRDLYRELAPAIERYRQAVAEQDEER